MHRARIPQHALDYPRLDDNLFVIWSSNGKKWPNAGREVHYVSACKRDVMRNYPLFTIFYKEAKTFRSADEAQAWILEEGTKHPVEGFYERFHITTVGELKERCGYV